MRSTATTWWRLPAGQTLHRYLDDIRIGDRGRAKMVTDRRVEPLCKLCQNCEKRYAREQRRRA